ncbi:DUF805 domain-containing protein [Acinetobacter pollinis]|uniref:DUF805 domain-containing protein n=1 Tax=Acinetobacter pollinis TaxID=2605270 RepID=A0ABU6DP94_9GAMM|nr:DUF805 domain-containing protein [Acinetobacter pollinis]MEB5475678.1 DUF805 domain-containing protein [Acinetobacter pollinis]
MKGTVLDFSVQSNKGIITLDEKRYHFTGDQWKEQLHPKRGQHVDFEVDEQTGNAINIYFVVTPNTNQQQLTQATESAKEIFGKAVSSRKAYNQAVITCFKKYFDINGRAARPEYWYFQLCATSLLIITDRIDEMAFNIVLTVFIIPLITITVRRLHDINRSGWWVLVSAVPIIGSIVILYWAVSKGSPEENLYGPPPQ